MTNTEQKHPKGLWVLFGTEMWERFNFYGMRAILTLFLVNSLLIKEADASIIYGGFLALCYLTPLLGGFLSDRYLGNRNCILIGGTMMAVGQFLLFFSASTFSSNLENAKILLWIGLTIIVFGNGFFKPNISSMVGSLYPKEQKSKLDSAFTIFYMGINIGALLSQYFCPLIGDVVVDGQRDLHAFKWGYLTAGIAMVIGTIIFLIFKNKYVIDSEGNPIGGLPSKNKNLNSKSEQSEKAEFTTASIVKSLVVFIVLFFIFRYLNVDEIGFSNVGIGTLIKGIIYPFIYSTGVALAVLILTDKALTKVETQRIWVIYIISFFVIFFWAAFEQSGSSLTFIASNQTDRVIIDWKLPEFLANLFNKTILFWEMPASMVQIFNGAFIVILALPFSLLWDKLRTKKVEPSSPMKQAIGLFLIGLSYFIIAHNVKDLGNHGLLALKWLVLLYFIHSCAELCLSPIGLALIGKLAPKRFASLLYGVFFLSSAAGYALSGTLGAILPPTGDKFQKAESLGINLKQVLDKTITASPEQIKLLQDNQIITEYPKFVGFTITSLYDFFMVFVVFCGIAAVFLFALSPTLKRMMNEVKE